MSQLEAALAIFTREVNSSEADDNCSSHGSAHAGGHGGHGTVLFLFVAFAVGGKAIPTSTEY